jgi:hypothetical protein
MVQNKIKSQRDPSGTQYGGQLAKIINAAEVGAYRPIIHDRVAAVALARPRLEQRHQVEIGDAKFGEIVHPIRYTFQVTCEKIGVGRVTEHLGVLKPLRIRMPAQIQQSQVGWPLLEVLCRDLHEPVGHLGGMVGVGTRKARQQVRPIALQPSREDNLIMGWLALEQRRQIRNSHCPQAIGAAIRLSAICNTRC